MGHRIIDVSVDDTHSLVVGYGNNLSIFDKDGQPIKVFTLEEGRGDIVRLLRKQNLLVICSSTGYFYFYDLMSVEQTGGCRCKGSDMVDSVIHFSFDRDFFKGVAGNPSGDLITFEIL